METLGIDLAKFNEARFLGAADPGDLRDRPRRRVRLAFVDADYRKRLEPREILEALRALA